MIFRNLEIGDFYNNYFNLLNQLTNVQKHKIIFDEFKYFVNNLNDNHIIIVIEKSNQIIASGTLFIENKIIHALGKVGHIEDVVVDINHKGKNIGRQLIKYITEIAEKKGCYKVILNCNDCNIKFYEKCEYIKNEVQMVKYFN